MKILQMIPKTIDFLNKPENVTIKEYEGFEIKSAIPVYAYKLGKQYIVIDPKIGLPILRYIGAKKNLESYVNSEIPRYIETVKENMEKIVRMHITYSKAKDEYIKEMGYQNASGWNPLVELAIRGTGTQGGKERIQKAMKMLGNYTDKKAFVKKEYGIGGFGEPRKNMTKYQLCRGDYSHNGKIKLNWYVPNQEKEIEKEFSYGELTDVILDLIMEGKYINEL